MPKMVITSEEAKTKLLEMYKKNNPDITEVMIEGLITIEECNKILKEYTLSNVEVKQIESHSVPSPPVVDTSDVKFDKPEKIMEKVSPPVPVPTSPEMIALVQSLQTVVDDGRILHIKYLRGPNKDFEFELTKGLESRCVWCTYVAMSEKDLDEHKNAYHKDVVSREKQIEQQRLNRAKEIKQQKISELDTQSKSAWKRK